MDAVRTVKLGRALLLGLVACAAGCQDKQATPAVAPAAASAPGELRDPAPAEDTSCARIVTRLRLAAMRELPPILDSGTQLLVSQAMTEARTSCDEDGWPDALKHCALATPDIADALSTCREHISPALHAKVSARFTKLMSTR